MVSVKTAERNRCSELFCRSILFDQELEGVNRNTNCGGGILAHLLVKAGSLAFLIPDHVEAASAAAAERIRYDIWYIENWTVALDVKILLRTVFGGKMVNDEKLN